MAQQQVPLGVLSQLNGWGHFRQRNAYTDEEVQAADAAKDAQDARDARNDLDDEDAQNDQDAEDARNARNANETKQGAYYFEKGLTTACPDPTYIAPDDLRETTEDDFWFKTPPLTSSDISQLTTLQLITHSRTQRFGNEVSAGSGAWFQLAIRGRHDYDIKKIPSGQSLVWLSHSNWFESQNLEWCRGRMFTKDDEIFEHLKAGDIISVWMSAGRRHTNHVDLGCLVFGFGCGSKLYQTPKVPPRQVNGEDQPPPIISVYARKRQECLMIPADGFSTEVKANIVQGGVDLIDRLLKPQDDDWTRQCHPLGRVAQDAPGSLNVDSITELVKSKKGGAKPPLQVTKESTIKRPRRGSVDGYNAAPQPKIIVWDDSGVNKDDDWFDITSDQNVLPKYQENDPNPTKKVLIYQMHAPLGDGVFWDEALSNAERDDLTVIVVIDADDLRADEIRISRGISWEKTMEDFNAKIRIIYDKMVKCFTNIDVRQARLSIIKEHVHFLVRCGYEGVFHLRPNPDNRPRPFVFHMVPNMAEGEVLRPYRGRMSGIHLAFVSGLAASLARQPPRANQRIGRTQIGLAIELAIIWSHRFASTGFCKDATGNLDYPTAKHMNNYRTSKIKVIYGDKTMIRDNGLWSLFSLLEERRNTVAAEVVKLGTKCVEGSIPTARFGAIQTADRTEIEGYRSTAAVIQEYLNNKPKKPLSIAVFGQPGAGKSFGLKQVIKAMLDLPNEWDPIEANLSQFLGYSDLVAVFHKIRDTALKGQTPVVLFDEFDSSFDGKPLGWLKYFLAPMQDGQFLDSGSIRPLGRAIFVFIGGTSYTFKEFKNGKEKAAFEEAVADKKAADEEAVEAKAKQQAADGKYGEAIAAKKAADEEYDSAVANGESEEAKAGKKVADERYNRAKANKEVADREAKEAETNKEVADKEYNRVTDDQGASEDIDNIRVATDKEAAYKRAADEAAANRADADEAAGRDPENDDKQAKKPDFISRLKAHINVRGPNRSGIRDKMFVMRRAMLLQAQLRNHFGVEVKDIQVDGTVLNALLKHQEFPNGSRSIDTILQTSRLSGRRRVESSDLASDEQLSMHVGDVAAFHKLIDNGPIALQQIRPIDVDLYNKMMWSKLTHDQDY